MKIMKSASRKARKAATSVFAISLVAFSANAQDVVLSANDGSSDVTGQLISYEGGIYTVQTVVGEIKISNSDVTCEGPGCPVITAVDLVVSGSDTVGDELMPLLLTGYANSQGAELSLDPGASPEQRIASLVGDEGFGDTIMSACTVFPRWRQQCTGKGTGIGCVNNHADLARQTGLSIV